MVAEAGAAPLRWRRHPSRSRPRAEEDSPKLDRQPGALSESLRKMGLM